ncbi:AMP-binding protein [Micromonospora sp. NPDC048830]|uniref:AMP-binding protein n=1 Tax=Micromonospora sp. NPDC048830 TaxID=3364257 RepID=UPI00371BFBEF
MPLDRIVPLAAAGPARVLNRYGPTEATVGVATFEVTADGPATGPVPTGRPLPHARVYVLDERTRPAPLGVPGELYLGRDRLARSYLNRPGLSCAAASPTGCPIGGGVRPGLTGDPAGWRPSPGRPAHR